MMWINLWITTKKVYSCIMQFMNTQKLDTANVRYPKCFIAAEIQWPNIWKETMILYAAKTFTAEWINFMIMSSKSYLPV